MPPVLRLWPFRLRGRQRDYPGIVGSRSGDCLDTASSWLPIPPKHPDRSRVDLGDVRRAPPPEAFEVRSIDRRPAQSVVQSPEGRRRECIRRSE